MKTLRRLTIGLAAAAVALFVFGRPVAWVEAALVTWAVAAGGAPTPWRDVTLPPREHEAEWQDGGGDVYLPAGTPRAAMVLVPGAAPLGRREPEVIVLARTLARAEFAVLVPKMNDGGQTALSPTDAKTVADALRQLRQWQPHVPLGLMAISNAVAPAIIAALEPDLAESVAFAVAISGYYESEVAIHSVTTGVSRKEPNDYGRWIFVRAIADRLDDPEDVLRLEEIAQLRFRDPKADIAPVAAALGPDGRAVLALFDNRDPGAVGRLIAALPRRIRREMRELNLALHDLSLLRGHLILVHGLNDRLVSHSESQRLARAASGARVSLFLVEGFRHAELGDIGIGNAWTMWRVMLELLDQRA
ncbi:MAG: hypothetical protein Q8K93_22120 [Reyranella sp.]|uniref:hypothetical protein n=1 Tax=Reyranella sp. TaxID=1929291 RepID=UPI002731C7C1|nr:hypothetical protein [Reyranella sp.]MDP1964889.1 hypothetical protein [Reyranella sp.]MDP2374054.1 hypothetical protein [Reyranella sp.]